MSADLDYLIKYLISECDDFSDIRIPLEDADKWNLLRALFNVRMPSKLQPDFISIQNAFLKKEIGNKGVTDASSLSPEKANNKIYLWQGDITTLKIDAIVNAANHQLLGCFIPNHGCIDNAIHTYAGVQLRDECFHIKTNMHGGFPTGKAVITNAYNLPAKKIIHTVGPIIKNELTTADCDLLKRCYEACIDISVENGIRSIAFCCISTGEFRFPQKIAAKIAVDTVINSLNKNSDKIDQIVFNAFKDEDRIIYKNLLNN